MGVGMNAAGGFMGSASATNMAQMQAQQQAAQAQAAKAGSWTCECGSVNTGKFCPECGKPAQKKEWFCTECGAKNTGKFCSECGKARG
jgi:membrane protease subunit (stomatin/prohibitin family)